MSASTFGAIEREDRRLGLRAGTQGAQRTGPGQSEMTALRVDPGVRRKRQKAGTAVTIAPEYREHGQTLAARDQHAAVQPAEGTQYHHPLGEQGTSRVDEQDQGQAVLHRLGHGDAEDISLGATYRARCNGRVGCRQNNTMPMQEAAYRAGRRRPRGRGGGKGERLACKIRQALP